MLKLENITLVPGTEILLDNVSWQLHPQQKIGLIGRNGTGKSSLIRLLVGDDDPFNGSISAPNNLRVGYLPQSAVAGSELPLWKEAQSALTQLNALRAQLQEAEQNAQRGLAGADAQLTELLELWNSAGGYQEDETIGAMLHGLGFAPADWQRPCSEFSGGWQMRIALAKLLLNQPDLAILDEPTNHLDIHARSWLAKHLSQAKYGLLLVSHDRYFLDQVIDRVVELRAQKLHFYSGNYSRFLTLRAERMEQEAREQERLIERRAQLQGFIDRFGAKATKARQAQSKKKQLEKLDLPTGPSRLMGLPTLRFPPPLPVSSPLFKLKEVTVGWPDSPPLLSKVNLELHVGMKLALVGANGSGKSSLFKTLVGELMQHNGTVERGNRLKIGLFQQDIAQELPEEETAITYLLESTPVDVEEIRKTLGALGLSSEAHLRPIKTLSGGERSRIALSELLLEPHNLLLLDEPSNHLDVESATALAEALESYQGTLLLISHDRQLLLQASTHLGRIESGQLHLYDEVSNRLLEPELMGKKKETAASENALSYADRKRQKNRCAKLQREIASFEEKIAQLELQQEELHTSLNQSGLPYDELQKLLAKDEELNKAMEQLMEQWEEKELELQNLTELLA